MSTVAESRTGIYDLTESAMTSVTEAEVKLCFSNFIARVQKGERFAVTRDGIAVLYMLPPAQSEIQQREERARAINELVDFLGGEFVDAAPSTTLRPSDTGATGEGTIVQLPLPGAYRIPFRRDIRGGLARLRVS